MSKEDKVINDLLKLSDELIRDMFILEEEDTCYIFREKNSKNYISVSKKKNMDFIAPVNMDFGFYRPAGSNNYERLFDLGKKLLELLEKQLNGISDYIKRIYRINLSFYR